MSNFWDSKTWGYIILFAVLFGSLLVGNMLKKSIPLLRNSLVPTSVLGGAILLIASSVFEVITERELFNTGLFGGSGMANLEIITYHTLALGFIASSLKTHGEKMNKKRTVEILNTGITTVSTYLLQGIVGMGITIVAAMILNGFFSAAGILLPFGFGQGTGQAMNYGNIYETEYGFINGKSFGLTIAALGFISASFGGVIHLNVMRKLGKLKSTQKEDDCVTTMEDVESVGEIPMQESIDKLTVQVALIFVSYLLSYVLMYLLALAVPGMKSTIWGFNFILGVLAASLVKWCMNLFKRLGGIKKEYTNNFLLTRTSNFFFDIMIVAGIAAIRLDSLKRYWGIMLILGVVGLIFTYVYNRIVAKTLFKDYAEEQFLAMYGMLTGTASTGVILLREVDSEFKTPASDNLVYQNFPAIALGFPMMLLATLAPKKPGLTLIIFVVFFAVLNVVLFRSKIFKSKK